MEEPQIIELRMFRLEGQIRPRWSVEIPGLRVPDSISPAGFGALPTEALANLAAGLTEEHLAELNRMAGGVFENSPGWSAPSRPLTAEEVERINRGEPPLPQ